MKTRSAKQKGRRLQQNVRDLLLEALSEYLEEDDIRSTSMGAPGEDLLLSPLARKIVSLEHIQQLYTKEILVIHMYL